MKIYKTNIPELKIIKPEVFNDKRGYFLEAINKKKLAAINLNFDIVQENQVLSYKGAIRGLHYQIPPFAQAKLVRALYGEIVDAAVDIRKTSPTFGKYYKILLTGKNYLQFWIPKGFAHCALTISKFSIMAYYTNNRYSEEHSRIINYNDPDINIDWGDYEFIVSKKDYNAPFLKDIDLDEIF